MQSFYTNVRQYGNKLLVRAVEDGERVKYKEEYSPYLFVQSNIPTGESEYETIHGRPVGKKEFDTIKDAKGFVEQYKDVHGFEIYGMNEFIYPYMNDTWPGDLDYSIDNLQVVSLDIETKSDDGFPDIETANKEITVLTIGYDEGGTRKYLVIGIGEYTPHKENVKYINCPDENVLLKTFLHWWGILAPDIVTGWNCIPVDQTVWAKDEILSIREVGDDLCDSKVMNRSPITRKSKHRIKLSTGHTIESSEDHKYFVRKCPKGKYTKLTTGHKSAVSDDVMTLADMSDDDDNVLFLPVVTDKNSNSDAIEYSDDQLYLAGFIFTDGSLKDKANPQHGYTAYQSCYKFMEELGYNGVNGAISGNRDKGYSRYISPKNIGPAHDLIYDGSEKAINTRLLSHLSKRQFYIFLSGLLDGDGMIGYDGSVSFCNYDGCRDRIGELMQWNGILPLYQGDNVIRLVVYEPEMLVVRNKRFAGMRYDPPERKNSQKAEQTKYKYVDGVYYARVVSIEDTGEECEMMDIHTDDNSFVSRGVKVHNCEFFDIPYLYNRIARLLGDPWAKKLSPWGIVFEKRVPGINGEDRQTYDIYGVAHLDYLSIYKKFTYNVQESYKLDHIASVELGVQKLDYSEYDTIHEFYEKDYQKFVEYNVWDTELIDLLENKLKLLELTLAIAFDAKINFVDALTSVKMWDVIIHNYLMAKGIVVPMKPGTPDYSSIVGGYVKDPYVDQHHWVVSFDLNSLYPHIFMGMNISPENFVEKLDWPGMGVEPILDGSFKDPEIRRYMEEHNVSITPNGCAWKRDEQGFLPALMERMYSERKKVKKEMLRLSQVKEDLKKEGKDEKDEDVKTLDNKITALNNRQLGLKVQLNSAYGASANKYFRWFDADMAESITTSGQLSIRWIERKINAYLNKLLKTEDYDYVIASDTDSIYLRLEKLVAKQFGDEYDTQEVVTWLDNACEKAFEPYIDKSYQELADYVNAFAQKMQMKREAIAEKGVWTGKKRYILNVWNNEGVAYETPKLKYMGIEAVRSSTPSSCRESIKEALSVIMNGTEAELMEFVAGFKEQFQQMPFESVAFPRGLNGMIKYQDKTNGWKKGTPVQVRGALLFNLLVKERKLTNRLELLKDGDKIKFCYLRMPNPTRQNVITFSDGIPHGFEDVEPFIDYTTQFEKAFLGPLRSITDVIGWELEQKSTLDGLFV